MNTRDGGAWFGAALVLLSAACGSVEVPVETFYRLPAPRPPQSSAPLPAVLRIDRLHLAANLAGDQLLVADGPVRMHRYQLHRWAGPVDELVSDALLLGLARSHGFTEVKGPGDGGAEDLLLSGTIVDFLQERRADATVVGRVTLELRLTDARSGREVFRAEFSETVPTTDSGPEAAAVALSAGLGRIVAAVLRRTHAAGVAARPR